MEDHDRDLEPDDVDAPIDTSAETAISLPSWLADSADPTAETELRLPVAEEADEDELVEPDGAPAVAEIWIDRSASRTLTEGATLFALVASQSRDAGWDVDPPALEAVVAREPEEQPPVVSESIGEEPDPYRSAWLRGALTGAVVVAVLAAVVVLALWLFLV